MKEIKDLKLRVEKHIKKRSLSERYPKSLISEIIETIKSNEHNVMDLSKILGLDSKLLYRWKNAHALKIKAKPISNFLPAKVAAPKRVKENRLKENRLIEFLIEKPNGTKFTIKSINLKEAVSLLKEL